MRQTIASDTKNVPSSSNVEKNMGQSSKKPAATSNAGENFQKSSTNLQKTMDVRQWTSAEVQRWIRHQCKKFELKNTNVDKFELNGQALILLSKNDFLRRSTDGEVLYYALQRLIGGNRTNKTHQDQNSSKQKHPRIVELNNDQDSSGGLLNSTSVPIIEEPDDPPIIRRTKSVEIQQDEEEIEQERRSFLAQQRRFQRQFLPMQGFVHQQHGMYPNGFVYPNSHQHFIHPHLIHQYYPMASAQGVLIELVDDTNLHSTAQNNNRNIQQEQLYMVTMNGQRAIMNEPQVTQLVNELYRRQSADNQPAYVFYQ